MRKTIERVILAIVAVGFLFLLGVLLLAVTG
jgi:hypothetical protein